MKKTYFEPVLSVQELTLGNNILSNITGDGNAPAFDGYTTDGEIPWD